MLFNRMSDPIRDFLEVLTERTGKAIKVAIPLLAFAIVAYITRFWFKSLKPFEVFSVMTWGYLLYTLKK